MLSTARRELTESLIVSTMLGMVTAIAEWLIKDTLIRSIVVGCLLLGVLVVLLLPQIYQLVRSYNTLASYKNFHERSQIEHQLMHQVRDMCLEMLVSVPPYTTPIPNPGCIPAPYSLLQQNRDKIITLLERVAQLFQLLVPPGTRVWACIRDRRADDCYYTFARAGKYNPNRSISSRPMHKDDSRTIRCLKDSLEYKGVCVLISGSKMGSQMWQRQPNDEYGEDQSVMLGAVLTKSWDHQKGKWSNPKLAWIIGVCADTENAFSETHIPLMQCCIDMFSMLANVMIRSTY
ncbi:hypothetical protein [uncultured Nostoc sp.]|uniref:hypothetical protein n=1 Tax=uncultured Nostoc sp. TaxID=340711 RepID=UPI0035CB032A